MLLSRDDSLMKDFMGGGSRLSFGAIQKGRPRSEGGGGQGKWDQLGQGEGGSSQSGRPFYQMCQG